jgi:hypothetical protein
MLCSLAVWLAEQKGYHQRPQQSWALSPEEIARGNRLFWVLYWLDKTISLRSGRPSVRPTHFFTLPIQSLLRLYISGSRYSHNIDDGADVQETRVSSMETSAANFLAKCPTSTPPVETTTTESAVQTVASISFYASRSMPGSAQKLDAYCIPQQHSLTRRTHY